MKWKNRKLIAFLFIIVLTACGEENKTFVYFTASEHVTDVLTKCLEENEIEYKLDDEQHLYVNEAAHNTAIGRCS